MKYDFDEMIERKNTYSVKYDFAAERGKPGGLMPLWVADMDFRSPIEITRELIKRCDHGLFGYTDPKEDYFMSVKNWFLNQHSLTLNMEHILPTCGIVFTINCAIRAFTKEGDGVLVQKPVYYPFFKSILKNNRKVVNSPLMNKNNKYEIDFDDFEHKIKSENVKLFLLCSPHNPVGRVWSVEELKKIGEICKKYEVIVISDEIHNEFALTTSHIPFWNAGEDFDEFSILCTSTSKAFNQAGLQNANILIKNPKLKEKLRQEIETSGFSNISTFGLIACKAAYDYGHEWLKQLKEYLKINIFDTKKFIEENLPMIKLVETQGTYLLWLDFRAYQIDQKELDSRMVDKAKLWLDSGTMFGIEGTGYQRINVATTHENVIKALENLKKAFD